MEIIAELLSTIVRFLVIEILFWTVFYWIGWSVCKIVTFGNYPDSLDKPNGKNRDVLVSFVGLAVSLATFISFIYWV
jgi:hypothetical protein